MDFTFSPEQEQLRDAVRRWVERGFTPERRMALSRDGGHARAVYDELAGLGLSALAVAEEHGGMGFGATEAMVVMQEIGRGLVHAPLAQAALIAPTVLAQASAELQSDWLGRMAAGDAMVVLAHQERGQRYQLGAPGTKATASGDAWHITGAKSLVPAGDEADAFIVPALIDGALALFLVDAKATGITVRAYPTQDGARAAELTLQDTPGALITRDGAALLALAVDVGIAAHCAEGVGLMERLIELTVEYMNTRKQFGVPIASFQALRHRMADVKMQLELARSMSYFASLKLNEPEAQRRRALSQAKVQLGQSLRMVGQQCVQMHGGIGITDEYIGSHYFKRMTLLEFAFGDTMHHLGEVSARLQDQQAGVFA